MPDTIRVITLAKQGPAGPTGLTGPIGPLGSVDSVNEQTGVVVLDADDIPDASTSNKYTTSANITKLAGIEALAEVNPTPAKIKTDYESNADTNAFTDDAQNKLDTLFMHRTLPITTSTDPAVDAAVTTSIIDDNSGTVITTTTTGNTQTLQPPADMPLEKFFMVANDNASTDSVPVNGHDLPPGFFTQFLWDGDAWIDLVDADGVSYVSTATNLLTAGQNVIGVSDTSATRTITISTADITNIATIGRSITIKDESGGAEINTILIDTEGSETIDGALSISIIVNYGAVSLYSNGTGLFVI